MVDLATNLGRPVPTPVEVMEWINPQLRFARAIGQGLLEEDLPVDTVWQHSDPGFNDVRDRVFNDGLLESALVAVKTQTQERGMAYDRGHMSAFVAGALREAWMGDLIPD